MKTFPAIYKGNRLLELCDDVYLAEDSEVLVVVPEGEESEYESWSKLALGQFLEGYAEADSIYDGL